MSRRAAPATAVQHSSPGCPNRLSQSAPPAPRIQNNRLGGGLAAIGVLRQQPARQTPQDPCVPSPCGAQAQCRSTGNRAVCSCPAGYEGDPYTGCTADPCSQSPCGENAVCERNGESVVTEQTVGDTDVTALHLASTLNDLK